MNCLYDVLKQRGQGLSASDSACVEQLQRWRAEAIALHKLVEDSKQRTMLGRATERGRVPLLKIAQERGYPPDSNIIASPR